MLHVIANVESDVVPRAIVGVCLVASVKHVVLGDEMCRHRMYPERKQGPRQKVAQTFSTEEVPDEDVKYKLCYNVQELQSSDRLGSYHKRAKGIEPRLEEQPNELGEGIVEELALPVGGKVHVITICSLESVMLHMVLLEGYGHGYSNGEVGPHSKQTVSSGVTVTENNIVRYVMYS